jgi:hypothetical protein
MIAALFGMDAHWARTRRNTAAQVNPLPLASPAIRIVTRRSGAPTPGASGGARNTRCQPKSAGLMVSTKRRSRVCCRESQLFEFVLRARELSGTFVLFWIGSHLGKNQADMAYIARWVVICTGPNPGKNSQLGISARPRVHSAG